MDIQEIVDNRWVQLGVVGAAMFASGFGLGHYVGKDKSIHIPAEPVEHYDTEPIGTVVINEDQLGLEFDGEMRHNDTIEVAMIDEPVEKIELQNVFAHSDDWDYEAELMKRSLHPLAPHIIHQDEFFGEESEFTQLTCTYYVGDDILVDEQDVPIHGHKKVIGTPIFGHGSLDKNVVYVRNADLGAEYEILKHDGFYAIEVLGYSEESKGDREAAKPGMRKFREE